MQACKEVKRKTNIGDDTLKYFGLFNVCVLYYVLTPTTFKF